MLLPILHAGGFSWDEALVLAVAILAVPAISWFTGRLGKRRPADASSEPRRRARESTPLGDETAPTDEHPERG